ncbi:MAG: orotidine-5'-phosphate decarboxylase [Acidobacteriaceae bacterium]
MGSPPAPAPGPRNEQSIDHLIVALDFPSASQAFELVSRLEGSVRWFKVGLELYLAAGAKVVIELKRLGYSVFLDLKLHDIPNTVAGAVRSASAVGADLLTVHAAGGPAMLRAAAEAASAIEAAPRLVAVTVLTSMDAGELAAIGITASPAAQVARLASLAVASGCAGLVCSPQEVRSLRNALPAETLLVTPGIRPTGAEIGDQKRVATPAAALRAGASFLVVGRPIHAAADPRAAAEAILLEMRPAGDE